jgi:hypothetical protein
MQSLIFQLPAPNPGQRLFEFSLILTPANTLILHSSFFIFHSSHILILMAIGQ